MLETHLYFYTKIKKLPVLKILDAAAPAVQLGQIIGRWGNFMNCEAYGYIKGDKILPKLPWRMEITSTETGETLLVHPTFLYESIWNLIGFIIINIIYKKNLVFYRRSAFPKDTQPFDIRRTCCSNLEV